MGDIDIEIFPGDTWGLVGENGNGKTTLLRMLALDLAFDSGDIEFPKGLMGTSKYNLRTQLTYLPQRTPTWYGAVMTNLKYVAAHYGFKWR